MLSELRSAIRSLIKAPGFLASAVLTLALGLGVVTSEFSVLNSLIFRRAPYPQSDQIVRIDGYNPKNNNTWLSPANFFELRKETSVFSAVALSGGGGGGHSVTTPGYPPEPILLGRTNADYFKLLKVPPILGRYFEPQDEHKGDENVVVLSYAYWSRRFGGNPGVVGGTVRLDGTDTTVIGVMPPGFDDPIIFGRCDCWAPQVMTDSSWNGARTVSWLTVYGRLRPGVSAIAAQAQLNALADNVSKDFPATDAGFKLRVVPLPELRRLGRGADWLLFGFAVAVLLIACANLASLQLARALEREREFAIRLALGASRWRLLRLMLSESFLLVGLGGPLGLLFTVWINRLVSHNTPISYTDNLPLPIDANVLCFSVGVTLVSAVVVGLAPAALLLHSGIGGAIKARTAGASGDRSRRYFRESLLTAEIAMSMVLVIAAIFFVGGYRALARRDLGWRPDQVLMGVYDLPWNRFASDEACRPFVERLDAAVAAMPGVESSALATNEPTFGGSSRRAATNDPGSGSGDASFFVRCNMVTPTYRSTVGLDLMRGRWIETSDRKDGLAVAVVSASLSKAQWPDGNPVGKRIWLSEGDHYSHYEVVGVVSDTRPPLNYASFVPEAEVYLPFAQHIGHGGRYLIRASGDPASLVNSLRATVGKLDPDLAVYNLRTAKEDLHLMGESYEIIDFGIMFYSAFGLLLVFIGVYSLVARTVHQRTREIGIRIALGAAFGHITELVVRRGLVLASVGIAVGVAGGVVATHVLVRYFVGFPSVGWSWFVWSSMGLGTVSWISCYLPARRASRIDPIIALRSE